ncbi:MULTISPECIES: ABC transporter substrate-binding protein [Bradyrhizobium]|uniref:ABC transporter substrate-binding protein n=1 Tax=Bradyrhizobium vignae TaxID=1549949 RepID=A0ABS4A4J0_9BRAD|nr:ABC transporter substrate-binding protein [Bradyrhizobium vignae]MBP0115327.1 ABC transporter substrate-binding protein [Bradyrhizobium vignae]RXH00898.1 ABC transporter substrate-binding protein [Bradyrhizobium vignae]
MRRRAFIALFGATAAAWPPKARAQQPVLVVGYLGSASPMAWAARLKAFNQGLSEAGFDDGRNIAVEYRWAEGNIDRLPQLANELVGRNVAVLVTPGSAPAALAAKAATTTIPIVFETGADPVEAGIVTNLRHPGGNITGVAALTFETGPKRLAILHELLPSAELIAVLVNPAAGEVVGRQVKDLQATALQLGLQLVILRASNDRELEAAFVKAKEMRVSALVIAADPFANSRIKDIADQALKAALPSIFVNPQFTALGGLMSYSGTIIETHYLAGGYVGRILKGEKPGELPVIQGTKVELIVNLRTAKALGIDVPISLLARADQVIE